MIAIESILNGILMFQITLFIILNSVWLGIYFGLRKKQLKKWQKMPPVSIVVPAYNKANLIRQNILSVLSLDYPKKEVIVVDDCSVDGTREICREFAKKGKIKLIEHDINRGKAAALNSGVKTAKNDIIVTVDADSFPRKDSLRKLVRYFADPKVGAVAGTIKVPQKKNMLTVYQSLEYLSQGFQRICQGFLNAIMVAPGPLTAYRREALAKAGHFDDDTFVEDFDMTIRIQKSGYKVVCERNAEAFTVAPENFQSWRRQRVRWLRGSMRIFRKHMDIFSNENTKPLAMFSFPIHVLWLGLPYLMISSYILMFAQKIFSTIQSFNLNFLLDILSFLQQGNIYKIYMAIEKYLMILLSLNNLNTTIILGYISVFIFLIYTFLSFRTLKEKFRPCDLKGIALISVYWYMLMLIFIYAALLELFKKKKAW